MMLRPPADRSMSEQHAGMERPGVQHASAVSLKRALIEHLQCFTNE